MNRRSTLRCESLERRDCPASQIFAQAGVLAVIGDNTDNSVTLVDLGNERVAVIADGQFRVANNINTVIAATFGGEDSILYYALRDSTGSRGVDLVAIDAGAGNDSVTLNTRNLTGSLTAVVSGGSGNDSLLALTGGVAAGAEQSVILAGLDGTDSISAIGRGEIDGSQSVRLVGGGDNDAIDGQYEVQAGSTGSLTVRENGGAGDDDLALNILGAGEATVTLDAAINGGAGTDTATSTSNVIEVNVEL